MLAVNGYDEPRDMVKGFMDERKLTHPVVLMGGKMERELYHVRAHPTTVWVDRQGNVVDIEIGFGPDGEKKLRATIEKLLAATK